MPHHTPIRLLILGGSSEATALVRGLAMRPDVDAILSLAGRTVSPPAQPIAMRIGRFGGVNGLITYLRAEKVDLVVDATHPFATQMSQHAREACDATGCRLIRVSRPPWTSEPGDDWREVDTIEACVAALGTQPRRVFLTIGSLRLDAFRAAPQHHYVIRTIDPVGRRDAFANATFIERRGPFDAEAEEALMRQHEIDALVTKNSGGDGAAAKLVAARRLRVPVILLRRPDHAACCDVEQALALIAAHSSTAARGV